MECECHSTTADLVETAIELDFLVEQPIGYTTGWLGDLTYSYNVQLIFLNRLIILRAHVAKSGTELGALSRESDSNITPQPPLTIDGR